MAEMVQPDQANGGREPPVAPADDWRSNRGLTPPARQIAPRWLHYWAMLTALLTVPLLFFGAEVTTKKVGMVDPVWPTSPTYLFTEPSAWEKGVGFLIEHGHRLAGWSVGFCVIVLAVGLWVWEPRRWVRWLGVAALLAVINQGLLGGMRVRLNALMGTELALVHGCFGQLVFTLLVGLVLCTSKRWSRQDDVERATGDQAALQGWSLLLTGLLVAQLILGAILRHKGWALGQRGHVLMAFAVVAAIVWLARLVIEGHGTERNLVWCMRLLGVLMALQLMLGVEAWFVRQAAPISVAPGHWLWNRDLVRTAHVLVGSWLLATSGVLTLEVWMKRRSANRNLVQFATDSVGPHSG
ncbi:MAG: COX15/CtaA family protein, partial [Planctomycetia bacterium]|nr:COX15/CtaA family protein [Planctomycetia bacterium]